MQRTDEGGIVISCDFCGTDWDPYDEANPRPMVEGHHGSVICLECVKLALDQMAAAPQGGEYSCTMCIREGIASDVPRWSHPATQACAGLNPHATICRPCIRQAAGRLSKDPDVAWKWENRS
jgi:hypothetical protein